MKYLGEVIWTWFSERAHTTHARAWLFLLSFTESSVFIVPPEVLLVPMLAADGRRWIFYALFTTFASVLGALAGYLIGYFFFDLIGERIVHLYHLEDEFAYVETLFSQKAFWVMFTAAFTPIPYKVFVLAGGFFHIAFVPFLIASILGRGLRYLIIAWVAGRFGAVFAEWGLRWANYLTAGVVLAGALAALLLLH